MTASDNTQTGVVGSGRRATHSSAWRALGHRLVAVEEVLGVPARTSDPDLWPAVFIEVADGQVEHLQRGLFGRYDVVSYLATTEDDTSPGFDVQVRPATDSGYLAYLGAVTRPSCHAAGTAWSVAYERALTNSKAQGSVMAAPFRHEPAR